MEMTITTNGRIAFPIVPMGVMLKKIMEMKEPNITALITEFAKRMLAARERINMRTDVDSGVRCE